MSAKDTLGNAPGLKEHEAKQNRVAHSSPNRPNGIAACCDALNEHCVNCNTYKNQQPLKAHGKQGLDVVLPGAAKLPVGKRSNGDGGQTCLLYTSFHNRRFLIPTVRIGVGWNRRAA